MARVYLVTYDLKKPGQNYADLIEELKKSQGWWNYLASTWLIYTDESADQLSARARSHLDVNDLILVIRVCNESQGWLAEDAWTWINNHVPQC